MNFGKWLRNTRKQKGLTLMELGDKIGYSKPYLSQIENGHVGVPNPDLLKKLSSPLGVSQIRIMEIAGHIPINESSDLQEENEQLRKENEQLKQKLKQIQEILKGE